MDYLRVLAITLNGLCPDLVGVYLHGSAVLGGFHPERSDLDVLVVVGESRTLEQQRSLGETIARVPGCPGTGLELSVITAATADHLGHCPFEVHVTTTGEAPRVVPGAGHPGDPDLVMHCAVCRDHAVAVVGLDPKDVFGPVPRERLLSVMLNDLDWAADNARPAYAVLNACRAVLYAEEGRLASKIDGGQWWLDRHHGTGVVRAALDCQRHGGAAPDMAAAMRFVSGIRSLIV